MRFLSLRPQVILKEFEREEVEFPEIWKFLPGFRRRCRRILV